MGDFDDSVVTDPDDVDIELHIFHPEAMESGRFVEEEHAVAPGQRGTFSEPKSLFCGANREFQRDGLFAHLGPAFRRFGPGRILDRRGAAADRPGKRQEDKNAASKRVHQAQSSPGGA